MLGNSDTVIKHILVSEGEEYTNDPHDPGGPTKWGITLTDVRLYIKRTATAADVRRLTRDQAIWIYKTKYWDALDGDELPKGLDYSVADYGVNSGIGRAGKKLRLALKLPQGDWHVTPDVIKRINDSDIEQLIKDVNAERLRFLMGLRTWRHFGRGWAARVASVKALSLQMHDPSKYHSAFPLLPAFGPGKAYEDDVVRPHAGLPFGMMVVMAGFGGLIALRNRKVD